MSQPEGSTRPVRRRYATNLALTGLAGQVGCVTLLLIGAALAAGLWLDNRLGTRPLMTLVLVFTSMPVTLILVVRLALTAVKRIQPTTTRRTETPEETDVDR